MHYRTESEGPRTFVLVHGAGCDLTFWEAQRDTLSAQGRIVLIDLPGHGTSDKPDIEYSMGLMASAVNAVLEETSTAEAVFIGHSMGVAVLREFYHRWPRKVSAIIALDGPVFFEANPAVDAMRAAPDFMEQWNAMVDGMISERMPVAYREKVNASMKTIPEHVARSIAAEMYKAPEAGNTPIKVPLLVVSSSEYAWVDDALEARIRSIASDTEFHRIDNVGHFLMAEKPGLIKGVSI